MDMNFIVNFNEPNPELETVGGKGLNLIRLTGTGMPVPTGFVVSTVAYQEFGEANGLNEHIETLLQSPGGSLAEISAQIRNSFEEGQFPQNLAQEITAAYRELCAHTNQTDLSVAVRSSATAEDLADASFAGQQDTYLNVRGEEAVLGAIKSCFGSLWSERAIDYRARQKLEPMSARLAVVVQQMVFADAAGVAFTVNPISGDSNHLVIDAAWGLGEALVSGLVTPDHILIDKRTNKILSLTVAEKTTMIVSTPEGTAERSVPRGQSRARVLSDSQIDGLTNLGKQIESVYGRPQDLEWCLADGQIYILQARPITTLPDSAISWDAPGDGQWLHGGGTFEMITEPVSPLFESFLLPIFVQNIITMMDDMGLKSVLPEIPYRVVNGYIYLHMDLHLRPWHVFGVIRDFAVHLNSMQDQEREQALYRQSVFALSQPPAKEITHAQILERLQSLGKAAMRYWLQIMKIVQVIYRQEKGFTDFYKRIRREGDVEAEVFLRGQKIRPWEAECSSFELAQLAQTLDGTADVLKENVASAQSILEETASGREFLAALEKHLSTYGHQLASFDPRLPTLADDPRPVLTEIQAFLNGKQSPMARQQKMEEERNQAIQISLSRLSARDQERFRNLLAEAQGAARVRENALFDVGLAWTEMHRCALDLGQRLVQASIITNADDIFWLRWDESQRIVSSLDENKIAASMDGLIRERRNSVDLWSKVEPPYLLPVGSRPSFWWKYIFPTPELQQHPDAHTLIGLGVSPGKITATARVVKRIEEMDQLNPGEILVAHTTTPAWTPLFARAAGLVTDLGGPLAHGSIVAREYGIPAVMGTGDATRKIRSGQTITVYGSEGKVRLE